jgi:hypothetical protein
MKKFENLDEANAEIERLNGVVEQKTQDVIGARRKYKTLTDMTDDEKAAMSPQELAQKEENDAIMAAQEETQKQIEETNSRIRSENRAKVLQRLAGADPKIAEKVLANLDRIKGADEALLESEIEPYMSLAINMLGDERPSGVQAAFSATGGAAPTAEQAQAAGFTESPAGQGLAAALNINLSADGGAAPAAPAAPTV